MMAEETAAAPQYSVRSADPDHGKLPNSRGSMAISYGETPHFDGELSPPVAHSRYEVAGYMRGDARDVGLHIDAVTESAMYARTPPMGRARRVQLQVSRSATLNPNLPLSISLNLP